MGRAIAHRGPDDQQFYDDGRLSLVFRRLSIVDTLGGRQPFFNEDGTMALVCNGEIYNHSELRVALSSNHSFTTASDCEVLLHAYEQWGVGALQRLRGMFSLALWDKRNSRLLLARDRFGIKPLYVCQLPNGLLFGSELKALLAHPQCPREMDWTAVDANPGSAEATPTYVKGIEYIPGGGYLLSEPQSPVRRGLYWRLSDHFGSAPLGADAAPYKAEFSRLIEEAALEHLQGDSPVALHLSGGIDSSLLAGIVASRKRNVPCFTMVERTTYLAGDVAAAAGVASTLGFPWHPVLFDYRTVLDKLAFDLEWLEQSVWMMDSPLFNPEWMIKQELTRAIRTHYPDLKVLLLGQGADEFAGGYSNGLDSAFGNWDGYIADAILPTLRKNASCVDRGFTELSGRDKSGTGPYHHAMGLMWKQLQSHNLWHEDRTSAWHSTEARVPFLDHRIVELLASVPESLHGELFWNKRIVRDCVKKWLPGYDSERPKIGFYNTNDMRSVEILVHSMVARTVQEFQDKYVAAADFPFDRDETLAMIQRTLARAPGFYAESYRLMARMTAAIFHRQVASELGQLDYEDSRCKASRLEVVQSERWNEIGSAFSEAPTLTYPWRPGDTLSFPDGASIGRSVLENGWEAFDLIKDEVICAHIAFGPSHSWAASLLERLDSEGVWTVQEGRDELGVANEAFLKVLDYLLQSGFIRTPSSMDAVPTEQPSVGMIARSCKWLFERTLRPT